MAFLIDGKKISSQIKDELKNEVAEMKKEGTEVTLAVIQVGNDPASSVYVGNKKKACAYIGIRSLAYELPESTTEMELLTLIDELNNRKDVNGILVQLPVPAHINKKHIIEAIHPLKDVDGFHPRNVGALVIRRRRFCLLYTGWHHSTAQAQRYRSGRQGMCGCRQKQHCRQANGHSPSS